MDTGGIVLEVISGGTAGRVLNTIQTIQFGYSLTEVGVDLFSLDFNQNNGGSFGKYEQFTMAMDIV